MAKFFLSMWTFLKDLFSIFRKSQYVNLQAENIELKEKVNILNEKIARYENNEKVAKELIFRDNAYWKDAEGPYCSTCWDSKKNLIRLHTNDNINAVCNSCNSKVVIDIQGRNERIKRQMNAISEANKARSEYIKW